MAFGDDENTPRLVVTGPADQAGRVLALPAPEMMIGHSDTADLILEDRFVSRRHALITIDPAGAVTIRDLNSTSGTFVNEERIEGPRVLRAGDRVRFADLVARFEPGTAPGAGTQTRDAPAQATALTPAPGTPDREVHPGAVNEQNLIYTVIGTVSTAGLPGVGGLTVDLVDKNVGGDQLLHTTQTGGDGSYGFSNLAIPIRYLLAHRKTLPDLQARVSAGGQFFAASLVSYSAPATVTLDVVLPPGSAGLPSEYEVLTANLAAAYAGDLGGLQEGKGREDITYLGNKTGWSPIMVALAALAAQFSQLTATGQPPTDDPKQTQAWPVPAAGLRPEFYYALFRAGLPASADGLFRADSVTVQAVWQQATAQNVIPPALASDIPGAVRSFQVLSAGHLLTAAPPVGVSTLQEMLAPTLPEAAQQQQFAELYAQYSGDWASLWPAAERLFGAAATARLQLTGQLQYLAGNNQPLVSALLAAEAQTPLASAADLAARGYYTPDKWAPLIGPTVPPGIPGADADERAANYAKLLAAQVRIAFPTAIVADQVRLGILPVAGTPRTSADVANFLSENQGQFQVGVEPVEAYLARTGIAGPPTSVITQVKRLQRVYQLTQDDISLAVLLSHNLDSAFAVTRYDAAGFARAFAAKLGGADAAAAIHARASQVFASTLGVAVGYLGGRMSPGLGGQVPVQYGYPPPAAPSYPVVAAPTLEDLFGSLDYCGCSDCGSILSPAAYLADLLNYIDQPGPSAEFGNPQDVLFGRRPDLQDLPLTCTNTNTALPYIDIVNETLEYYVANGLTLDGYQGHDTGDAVTSVELVASPQYVNDAAYAVLRDAFFPPPLPFSRPLTLLRLHLRQLGLTLPDAMATLRAGDQLTSHATPASYGWRDILMEQLTISRDEYRLFTDPDLQLGDLYGLPNGTALTDLQAMSLQDLSRRLGVSYDDLAAIVSTQFLNQNAALIPRLQRLNAPFTTLKALHDTLGTAQSIAADFIAALPAGLDATQYGGTGSADYQAVVNWVTGPAVYPLIMDIITISGPAAGTGDCSAANLQLRYSNPDNADNLLSGTDYLKLIRFIRLWRKLWPLLGDASDAAAITHTDHVITALYPAADLPAGTSDAGNDAANRPLLDAGFAALLPRLGFLFRVMDQLALTGTALDQLLACWAPIGTAGLGSLYQVLFLTPTLLQQDPGAQTATVAATVNVGDTLHTAINLPAGQAGQVSYTVQATDTAASAAAAIAAAINTATALDPVSGLPLNARFHATSAGEVITIRAGFTLACSVSAGASETCTAAATSPLAQSATIAGSATAGDALTASIDGVPVSYTVAAADTPDSIAAAIAAAINAATVQDPYCGLPLNSLVVASSAASVVTIRTAGAGAPFSLACSLTPANAGTYAATSLVPAACTATVSGTVTPGDTLVTTVNAVQVRYTATATDTDAATLAASIAAAINAAVQPDPATGVPLGLEVQAASAGGVVTITPADPATQVTLACSVAVGGETYVPAGPFPETATATVAGTISAGAMLTTTVNTLPLQYQAAPGDTPATIATAIASAINATTTADPVTGLSLNSVVGATAAGGTITLRGTSPTTPFTLTASLTTGGYTAGSQPPPFADNGYGGFLTDPAQTLFGHQPTLCAACGLTGAEFALIAAALGFDASTPLTLDSVSALFRFGWLAHAMGLSVLEFLRLREFTGLDAFAPLDPSGTGPAEPPPVRYIRLLAAARAAGLTNAQVLYLLWNQDLSGTSAPAVADVTGLASALRADFAAIDAQFTLQDDPDGSIAQSLMALVYGATASALFFGLLNGTFTTSVQYAVPPGQSALPAPVSAAGNGRLGYDDLRKQLSYGGVLDAATCTAIDAATSDPQLRDAVNSLAAASQRAVAPFFTAYPELAPLYAAYVASSDPVQAKRQALLDNFLPVLKNKRKQEQALASVTSAADTDAGFATALLQDPAVLHADADPSAPAVADLTAIETQAPITGAWSGYLTVPQDGFYDFQVAADPGATVTLEIAGAPVTMQQSAGIWQNHSSISLVAGAAAAFSLAVSPVSATLTVSWQSTGLGWEIVPGQNLYPASLVSSLGNTYVRFLKTASLASALSLTPHEIGYLAIAGTPAGPGWLNSLATAGDPSPATAASLCGALSALLDYARVKQALSPADERLLAVLRNPAAALPGGRSALLALTGWDQASVNALLTQFFGGTDPASLATAENLGRVFDAYALVKGSRLPAAALLAAITNAPSATTVSALQSALRARYAEADWLTVVRPISDAARIAQRDALVAYVLQRLGDGYAAAAVSLTTSAAAASGATSISCVAVAGVTAGMTVTGAGIAPGTVVTAVAGTTVTLGTGLLVALPAGTSLLALPAGPAFDNPDSLYEQFLIDTQTQPAVLTSRIRLALSAVQLFVERVIRNLEPQASPSDISAGQWQWMKRYRVWQANREVFLWPENWLYPELRDDQSPFFQTMMSSLLQGDITGDAAASAYLDYLTSLEEVAKLEPCGLYYKPGTADTDETSYVVARTAGATRKHYFRQLSSGAWTPWTQVQIDCEDVPITPVVWNGRLFLFWLKVLKQTQPSQPQLKSSGGASTVVDMSLGDFNNFIGAGTSAARTRSVCVQAVLCWTEFYSGKWQPTKTSDVNNPTELGRYDITGSGSFESLRTVVRIMPAQLMSPPLIKAIYGAEFELPGALILEISAPGQAQPAGYVLHNTNSQPVPFEDISIPNSGVKLGAVLAPPSPARSVAPISTFTGTYVSATFGLNYQPVQGSPATYSNNLLKYTWRPQCVQPQPGLADAWDAPFLYGDPRYQFYVTTTESLVPVWRFPGFGILSGRPGLLASAPAIAPLVLSQPTAAATSPQALASSATSAAGDDPAAVQRFIADGTNIKAAVALPQAVTYQGQLISLIGSVPSDPAASNGQGE